MGQSPQVLILLGSANDESYLQGCVELLKKFEVPYVVRVASAHRSPERVLQVLNEFRDTKVIVAFAGHAAHLAGVVSAHVTQPVIAVPLPTSDLKGFDALLASVQMPAGIPVAVMAIGDAGARNAACLSAQILGISDPAVRERIKVYRDELRSKVESGSTKVEDKWR